jgi:hypothetical protein
MRKTSLIVWVTGIWFAATPAAQAGTVFDGQWTVNIVCPAYQDAEAYTEHFSVVIQNGQLLGQRGTAGQPGYLTLGGTVADDGTIKLSGTQLTNNPDYSVGHVPAGTKIPFTVNGKMDGDSGQGTRTEVRPCTYYFNRAPF